MGMGSESFSLSTYKNMSMTRKCHNHKPRASWQHHKEEAQNTNRHKTAIKVKQTTLASSTRLLQN